MNSIRDTGSWNFKARRVDMAGQRFERLVVLRAAESDGVGRARWLCACDCGGEAIYRRQLLICGQAKSCGCLRRETARGNGRRCIAPTVNHQDGGATLASVWR